MNTPLMLMFPLVIKFHLFFGFEITLYLIFQKTCREPNELESIKDILQLNLTFQPRFEKTSNCNISNSVNEPSYMTCMNHPHDVEDDMDTWHNIINTKLFDKRHVLVSYIMLCHILLDMPLPKICSIEKHVLTKKQKIQMQIKVYNSPCLS